MRIVSFLFFFPPGIFEVMVKRIKAISNQVGQAGSSKGRHGLTSRFVPD